MIAAVMREGSRVEVAERPLPEPEAHEVRVRITACGICGSDLHLRRVGMFPPETTPGHEFAGVVDAAGPEVTRAAPGDAIAVEPFRSCGGCDDCRAGRDPLCREAKLLGLHDHGGMAEYVVVPERRLFPVPEGLEPAVAALAEPTAVAIHGLRRIDFAPGQRILVLGAGSVGLLTLLAARALGAGEVWITARHPHQTQLARALGAKEVLGERDASPEALSALGAEQPFDGVVETVGGSADTLLAGAAAVRPAGSVSVLGVFMGRVELDPLPLLMKEVTLAWSYCYHRCEGGADFADAVDVLAGARDQAALLNTHAVPLAEAARAFDLAEDRKAGAVKVSVLP